MGNCSNCGCLKDKDEMLVDDENIVRSNDDSLAIQRTFSKEKEVVKKNARRESQQQIL